MALSVRPRGSFTPEALRKFSLVFDDVWKELAKEGLFEPSMDERTARARLAKKVFALARSPWTEIQIKQLLVRAFRNETARAQRIA
jgi:hypothetical protein